MGDFSQGHKRGIPLKRTITIFAIIMTFLSALLVVGIVFNWMNYHDLINVANNYVTWEEKSKEMVTSSDYLTDQVRAFVTTGDRRCVDNYFTEADETRRRESALIFIAEHFPNSDAYFNLEKAMEASRNLMFTEYKAMRLKAEALGDDLTTYDERVATATLTEAELALSSAEKDAKAHSLLIDKNYSDSKEKITSQTDACIKSLVSQLKEEQDDAEFRLRFTMIYELVLIAAFIALSILIVSLTSSRIFTPLIRAIPYIEKDAPLPVQGGYEIKMFAYAYNLMYESNRRKKNRLEFKAEHDALTGALNRNAFENMLTSSEEGQLAFLILDIDNFKQINDNYGHMEGDKVLVRIADLMRENFRSEDSIFRIGGDEFAVVLFGIDENSKKIIQNKYDRINDALVEDAQKGAPEVTISAGVAFGTKLGDTIMSQADTALYVSKNSGKACCSFFKN